MPRKPTKQAAEIERLLLSAFTVVMVVVAGLIFADSMISYIHFIANRI